MPTRIYAKKSRLFIQELFFQHHHSAIHYQPQNNRRLMNSMSRKHRDVKQDLENKWFRHPCILQKVIHWAFYTSFIKLDLNWGSHPDSRNHHTSFPFKRGNKHLISKAVSIRGSPSPSLALCLTKPPRQSCLPYRWPSEVQRDQVFCL